MAIKTQMEKIAAGDYRGDAVITYLFEGTDTLTPDQATVERRYRGIVSSVIKSGQFRGEKNETCHLTLTSSRGFRRLVLVGLGKQEDFKPDVLRQSAATGAEALTNLGLSEIASTILDPNEKILSFRDQAELITQGAIYGAYRFERFISEKKPRPASLESFTLLAKNLPPIPIRDGLNWGRITAEATNYARDLGNSPANEVTPDCLASEAARISGQHRSMRCRILERQDVEKIGMGAFLAVNRASSRSCPLKFIMLDLRGSRQGRGRKRLPKVGLIGKGITFDTGGISLKSSKDLHLMKFDMCGAAAVLATMQALAELRLPVDVVAMIPATENMPGESATRPGDIVKSLSGKTVEVINTDAEGRMILCDALTYMKKENRPDAIVDLATLTGACEIALGEHAAGLFSNHDAMVARLLRAGSFSGERVWRMPLWPEYHSQLKSNVADMKNVGGRPAGAVTAACFLEKFVEKTPWAHIDIAGVADRTSKKSGQAEGATGFGVRLLTQLLRDFQPID